MEQSDKIAPFKQISDAVGGSCECLSESIGLYNSRFLGTLHFFLIVLF